MAYEELSSGYDKLTTDVCYPLIADFLCRNLAASGIREGILLDLACGTGTLSYLMGERGYEVIGVDLSEEMLAVAAQKMQEPVRGIAPVFIRQDMRELDLYGTVDACICMLDSLNYILSTEELAEVFRRVSLFLNPGGVFIFDINTPAKLAMMDGQVFADEDERNGVFCIWRTAMTDIPRTYQYLVDVFERTAAPKLGEVWRRGTEEHLVFAHEPSELIGMLREAGFSAIRLYGEKAPEQNDPVEGLLEVTEKRIYYICVKNT